MTLRRRLVIHGRVQGVFFRESTREQAEVWGVLGWVRNRNDGTVEAVLEGDDDAVLALTRWCHVGPPQALVTRVEVTEEAPKGEISFRVSH